MTGADPVSLGSSDLVAGPIAYGCWRLTEGDVDQARTNIETALDEGMTLIDTADIYGSGFGEAEELLGQVLAADPSLRDRMVLATKGGIVRGVPYDSSDAYLVSACEASLRRLGVDVIDIYQVHRPDLRTHPADLAETLTRLRSSGKVREIGLSNETATQFDAIQSFLDFPICTTQPELSLLHLDPIFDGSLDHAMQLGVTPLAWSPLGRGALGSAPEDVAGDDRLSHVADLLDLFAARAGATRASVALAFVLAHPARPIPIIGTQNPDRIREASRAIHVELSRSDWYDLLEASLGERMP